MRITRKLGLLVGLPLVAVVGFAGLAVVTTGGAAARAEQLRRLMEASAAAGELLHQLQAERVAAVLALTGAADAEPFLDQTAATDVAAQAYTEARQGLPGLPAGTAGLVARIDGQLARLDGLRQEVTAGGGRASAVAFSYRISIAGLLSFRGSVGQAGGASAEVADHLRAAAAVSQATEAVGLLQVAVLRAAGQGPLSQAAVQEITAARTARLQAQQDFDAFAAAPWQSALEQAQVGDDALEAQELEDAVARTPAGDRLRLDVATWAEVTAARVDRLHEVEALIDGDILAEVTALRDSQRRLAAAQVAGVLLAVVAAVALAIGLGRPVVVGLRRLRNAADQVAHRGLPEAVARLESHQQELGSLTADQFADQTPAPIPVTGRDELAELAVSFNSVHREAVRTAAGQALLRLLVGQMIVSLARRGQRLAGQLTAAMDDLERNEEDKKRLAQLFQVDNLVTLLGRANDALLVLGGVTSSRIPVEQDPPLADVLTAAAGRVRNYQRVKSGLVDGGVALRASVVDDVVLLLAELIDNAVQSSPPETEVVVSARWLGSRAVVQVVDEGVGISDEDRAGLNTRLASPPALDLQAVRQMGLTVVSMLAHRHVIRVELHSNDQTDRRGITAEVTVPAGLVSFPAAPRTPVPAGRTRPAGAMLAASGSQSAAVASPQPSMQWPPQSTTVGSATVELPTATGTPYRDASPPLVIYEQVRRSRSMWFTTADEAANPAEQAPGLGGGEAGHGWQTAADAGWQAAAAAADPVPAGTTASGLPKRQRGAQLVPGGVEQQAPPAARTSRVAPGRVPDPARVSAAAAAFSRGLAGGVARPAYPRQRSAPGAASPHP